MTLGVGEAGGRRPFAAAQGKLASLDSARDRPA